MYNLYIWSCFLAWTQSGLVSAYRHYRLEDICGENLKKHQVYLHNEAAVFTFKTRNENLFSCHIELQLYSDSLSLSVFIENMTLDNTTGCTNDFLQVGRKASSFWFVPSEIVKIFRDMTFIDSQKGIRRCGSVQPTERVLGDDGTLLRIEYGDTHEKEREYAETDDKEMNILLSIHPPGPGETIKQLRLVVTPFKSSCIIEDYPYKPCPGAGSGRCVKGSLFCDGERNCPGEWGDEQEQFCLQGSYNSGDVLISTPVIFIIAVFLFVVLMFSIFIFRIFSMPWKLSNETDDGEPIQDFQDQLQDVPWDYPASGQSTTIIWSGYEDAPPGYSELSLESFGSTGNT